MNLLSINDLTKNDVNEIFLLADKLKEGKSNLLKGKTFILFFPESSIRTRISFEKGIKDLGGNSILFPPTALNKREELKDVIKYIENWADLVVIRHPEFKKLEEIASSANIPIINAMTKVNHPCEILSDMYSIRIRKENFKELTYTFVGPDSNIFNSWLNASTLLDFKLNHVCRKEYKVSDNFYTKLDDVLDETDILLTDSLPQELRNDDYISDYQVTLDRLNKAKENVLLNPCPPFYRGEEVSVDAIDSKYFVGHNFKKNLKYVQQAIILYCLGIR